MFYFSCGRKPLYQFETNDVLLSNIDLTEFYTEKVVRTFNWPLHYIHSSLRGQSFRKGTYFCTSSNFLCYILLTDHSIFITGGVTYFAAIETAVSKWVMNRPFQIRFVESLIDITGLSKTTSNPRKCLRPSEVLKSNKIVENIITYNTIYQPI